MLTCSYCGTNLKKESSSFLCTFCNAIYNENNDFGTPSVDNERTRKFTFKGFITIKDVSKSLNELSNYHTIDLLLALRLARSERTESYYLIRVINNASDEMSSGEIEKIDTDEMSKDAGDMYTLWTRRMWMIENLLIDRMGFYPVRITDDFIEKMIKQYNRSILKPMRINRERQSNFKS